MGKLRLLFEANPMAFLMEQAGGGASTGLERLLAVQPTSMSQCIGACFGSLHDVDEYILACGGPPALRPPPPPALRPSPTKASSPSAVHHRCGNSASDVAATGSDATSTRWPFPAKAVPEAEAESEAEAEPEAEAVEAEAEPELAASKTEAEVCDICEAYPCADGCPKKR